jgi:pimeloyl-ACP methyl ester carboxylesterase
MFGVTQTHRFRAAVAGAGISDWQSYYGENSIDQWMVPFFGATVYEDPAVYAKSSAINYIKNVTTPTLVIVGDRDGECPAPQSFEFWHALRAYGVKTQLVIYPNEGHGFRNPEHIADRSAREIKWFAENMPAKESCFWGSNWPGGRFLLAGPFCCTPTLRRLVQRSSKSYASDRTSHASDCIDRRTIVPFFRRKPVAAKFIRIAAEDLL